ncbi:ferrous iron transport protein B [uncultured Finegoldia sp.]|uniref:ferrous iron transport protein B n=1 Tax=uncultured Finegoldia sp. TaxID=328009 RepID=UPI002622002D|nr:ferrous iron transport protein B [uncultured Finegoldia sp.]
MSIRIALAGNPNSGKSTLFNALTGSNQYVGNWPGVTVEKKEGSLKKKKEIKITDLPGIYSLSPYTLEEVVSRNYLINEKPDVIINVIDASNIERNLYLSTQLSEIGIPMVLAFNMMDVVKKNNDKIDTKLITEKIGVPIVEVSALKKQNLDELIAVAEKQATSQPKLISDFSEKIENVLTEIENSVEFIKNSDAKRWFAIKALERDEKAMQAVTMTPDEKARVESIVSTVEDEMDDDGESIITDERYSFITSLTTKAVKKGRTGLTVSDKIDRIVTNRFLALPIFVLIMMAVYYIAVKVVGGPPFHDWWADVVMGSELADLATKGLEVIGTSEWLTSLVVDGIVAGVGAVLGFLPMIATLELLLAILEDIGYMSRIAFILDRMFRKFGLSGKSFIPILIGTGCSVPGIMATRTIENENDRKMTIIVASFMPCGAKTEIIALFAAAIFGQWWFAPLLYFTGILAVIISGLILKKTKAFSGEPAPFVMELPEYHTPTVSNFLRVTWDRTKSFIIKAGTIILVASICVWFLQNISVKGEFVHFDDNSTDTILAYIGKIFAPLFAPLGFGNWTATVASFLGTVAKEMVVSVYGIVSGVGDDADKVATLVKAHFTIASALSFLIFNQLTVPCFAAVGAIKEEMNSGKWTAFAICYQIVFAYIISFMVYQFLNVLVLKQAFTLSTGIAVVVLVAMLYLIFRKDKYKHNESKRAVQ